MLLESRLVRACLLRALLALAALAAASAAQALPSYARQTSQDCAACHVGAFGPQLTPYGVRFKWGGYADSDGQEGKVPLSAMLVGGSSRFRDDDGNRMSRTQLAEASVFLAGRLADHLGTFIQVTHDGVEHSSSIDHVDIRYARDTRLSGHDLLLGLSLNNNPTVQDPLNTLPVWSFPFVVSPFGNAIGAEFMGVGGVEHKVLGLTGYAVVDEHLHAELGAYNTLSPSAQARLGLSRDDANAMGRLSRAPYWRLAYVRDLKTSAWSIGAFGFDGRLDDRSTGSLDARFRDRGVDASYQYLGTRRHVFTLDASWERERQQTPDPDDAASVARNELTDRRLAASYHYANTYGGTAGVFNAASSDGQSANRGLVWQVDWTPWGKESSWAAPWANVRLGLQRVHYLRYVDGGVVDERASDRDTTYLFVWGAL
jgi:hypothetical protein